MAQGHGPVLNPIAHLAKVGPQPKPLSREQKAIHRRVAKFDALRAQEDGMPMVMQDLNPGEHQKKATFRAGPSQAAPAPPQQNFQKPPLVAPRPPGAVVQRVARPLDEAAPLEPDMFDELEAELGQPDTEAAPSPDMPAGDDADIEAYIKRFKGTPDELVKQLAKSGVNAEKRMRQVEAEKNLLLKGQTAPPTQTQAAPVPQQIQVQPEFNYKRFKDDILDKGDQVAKDFEQHVVGTLDQKVAQVVAPLYEEAIDNRLFRKYGDVVTEDNLDLIKAMAQSEPGQNRWEKMVSAVTKYKTSMPAITTSQPPDVTAMQQAGQLPNPQARTSGEKKMYKQSDLQSMMQKKMKTGEWQRDPKWSNLVNAAYRDGRVLRGQ